MTQRRYPVGIQTFPEMIQGGYVYVDKTDLMWQMQDFAKYIFLSRPRRFGKSLLSSTFHSFFSGKKELFEGLKVMELEKDWKQYPVIHIDLSLVKGRDSAQELQRSLKLYLSTNSSFGTNAEELTPGEMLTGMIRRAYEQTKCQVVVIVDEYDAPLLDVLHEQETLEEMRRVMQEFFMPLKACEAMVRFCFITGITKFSQLSIFSTINNLKNVSLLPRFSAICGITEQEVRTIFAEEINRMSRIYGCTPEAMFEKIKDKYDGYHFASVSEDIYNPFSLLNAFADDELNNYWFASGTPTFLIRQMQHFHTDITSLESMEVPSSAFDQPTESLQDALPLLYQSGYLTIKGYDRELESYQLSFPNQEVRVGYVKGLLPVYTGLADGDVQMGFAAKFWKALKTNDLELAMREMQAYMAGIPYVEGFKRKLADAATAEGFYEYTFYLIFSMLNVYVRTQVKCNKGRADIVVWMPDTIYVMELKTGETAENALNQIRERGYATPYLTDGRNVVKVGIHFDTETRTIDSWAIDNRIVALPKIY